MKIQHLVITRFNVTISREGNIVPSLDWLQQRMTIFEQYCLPSMMVQTCTNFIWLILMDESTPIEVRDCMTHYQQQVPMMRVLYVSQINDLTTFYHQLALEYTEEGNYVLTTRIDNDDVVCRTYIADIQYAAAQQEQIPVILTFPHGCQLFLNDSVGLGLHWLSNHFVSLLELRDEQTHTILDYDHTTVGEHVPIYVENTSLPSWGEVVHSRNVSNDYTPHNHPSVERWNELPFAGDWNSFLHYWRNVRYLMIFHTRYRVRSMCNLFKRLIR